ncbi:MAG TPA: hypothetical protein VFK92_01455 [Burkholderiales bacterium]|nr:hypothetical protein [Burkholderiales bacterium]
MKNGSQGNIRAWVFSGGDGPVQDKEQRAMRTLGIVFRAIAVSLVVVLGGCGAASVGPTTEALADPVPPTISIASPTAAGTYSTVNGTVAVSGSASDNVRVTGVTWSNAANGGGGSASGTASWSVATIVLVAGVNTITVTAHDAAGNTGTATLAVTYTPGGTSSLSGTVDSSLISRGGTNTVYVYTGTVTPTGSTTPFATTAATQDNGACTFSYQFGSLPAGTYTVAFSSNGATFRGTSTVTLPAASTYNFPPNRLLRVGPTRVGPLTFAVPSAAIAAAQTGDVIEIDAGTYVDDTSVWGAGNLTLRGVGGRAHMQSTQLIANGKGIWVTSNNAVVENIEFSGAAVSVSDGENGAGLRVDGNGLVVCNGYFHDNQNGILDGSGVVLVEYSEFDHNGQCPPTNSCSHNMYFSQNVTKFTLQYSYSHRAHEGHLVKSRAQENHILYNRIMDETGDASYEIDLPQTGLSFIIGNLIQKGTTVGNSGVITFGVENANNPVHELYVVNNTIVNDSGSSVQFLSLGGGFTPTIRLVNNIVVGNGSVPSGAGITSTTNLFSNTPGLVDRINFDYHLISGSPARDAGTDPGGVGGASLVPTSQYVQPTSRENRPVNGAIDIGAYEFQ